MRLHTFALQPHMLCRNFQWKNIFNLKPRICCFFKYITVNYDVI